MSQDPHQEALRAAAAPTLERIRNDRKQAPVGLKAVFTVVARELFRRKMSAKHAWETAEIHDHRKTAGFKAVTGKSLKAYIRHKLIEVADVLIKTTDLPLGRISGLLGYGYHATFIDNYVKERGKLPSEVPRSAPKRPLIDDATSSRAGRGDLSPEEAVSYHEQFLRIYPHVGRHVRSPETAPEPLIVIGDARTDGLTAEGLWQKIRELPLEEQKRHVRRFLFHSTVLFDLLRQKSRLEGRKSRPRGIELAELALVSLEKSDEVFGERIHDLRALGWAWLGNAHRLALDFSEADIAFEQADLEWFIVRGQRDPCVLASICDLKGTLRMFQRNYDEAQQLLDRSVHLLRESGDQHGVALALVQRAALHGYARRLPDSLRDLREAAGLIDEREQRALAFATRGNLANSLTKAADYAAAEIELARARRLLSETDYPLGAHIVDWIEGFIREGCDDLNAAAGLYASARTGFVDADDQNCVALISVDLMVVQSKRDAWESVMNLATDALPILESQRLHRETVVAVGLLAQAVSTNSFSCRLLQELRELLLHDPLARQRGAEGARDHSLALS